MDGATEGQTLEKPSDLGNDDRAIVKRWLLEIKLADKRDKEWRQQAENTFKTYRGQKKKANAFNILWSNTETLRPAIYNSTPKPDVRKRYKDGDKIGKAVSTVLSRALEYITDAYDFDANIQNCVLDMLLPGRAVARVKYIPTITGNDGDEQVTWESVECEQVQWDKFRILSAAKTWDEVNAVAFEHRLSRDELVERFGDAIGNAIPLDDCADEEVKEADQIKELFKTAVVHEIWDKDTKKVYFIAPAYKDKPASVVDDPLELIGFFPVPRPLYAIEDSNSLTPTPLYELYREQAMELDRVSGRINTLIKGLKLRGIYDSTLSEMSELMRGEDNDLFPAQNVTALLERGGLDKAIWMMPIKDAAAVLRELYIQRDQTKQVIYEITGISDIVRGASEASETATAQQIKSQWGSLRIKRMQSEVQRFIRDLIRIKAEIISEKFQMETLEAMTLVNLPHEADVQAQMMQMMQQHQMMSQQAMMQGQQPPPPPQMPEPPVTWERVLEVMRSDVERSYRVDIETDSTIAASVESDMEAMSEVVNALGSTFQALIPVVQVGALEINAVKELALSIVRRAKLGNAVEDAMDGMKAPAPVPQEQDNSMQVEQMRQQAEAQKMQAEQAAEQQSMQFEGQVKAAEAQAKMQGEQAKMAHDAQMEQMRQQYQAQVEGLKAAQAEQQIAFDKWKAQLEAETKILVAQIGAETSLKTSAMSANAKADELDAEEVGEDGEKKVKPSFATLIETINQSMTAMVEGQGKMMEAISKPKKIIRGPDGRVAGVQ